MLGDTFGAVVMAETLEAAAEFALASPKRAAAALKKIGAAIRARVELNDHERAEARGLQALAIAHGGREPGPF